MQTDSHSVENVDFALHAADYEAFVFPSIVIASAVEIDAHPF